MCTIDTDVVDLVFSGVVDIEWIDVVNAVMVCSLPDAVAVVVSAAAGMVGADAVDVGVFIFFFMGALLIFCLLIILATTAVAVFVFDNSGFVAVVALVDVCVG